MYFGTHLRPPFHLITRGILLVVLLAASLTLVQCRQVGDGITGVNVDLFRRKDECTAQCQDEFKARNMAEDKLNEENIAACGGDPACLAAEAVRHENAENDSKALRDVCMNACHSQGGGTIGQ